MSTLCRFFYVMRFGKSPRFVRGFRPTQAESVRPNEKSDETRNLDAVHHNSQKREEKPEENERFRYNEAPGSPSFWFRHDGAAELACAMFFVSEKPVHDGGQLADDVFQLDSLVV